MGECRTKRTVKKKRGAEEWREGDGERERGPLVLLPNRNQSPKKEGSLVFSSRMPPKYTRRRGKCVCGEGWCGVRESGGHLLQTRSSPENTTRGFRGSRFISDGDNVFKIHE